MAELAVMNALISQCNNKRVAACLKEGAKCGVTAGAGAAVGFLLGGPVGCAIGGFFGASLAASNAKGPSLVSILRELDPDDRNDVAWELLSALQSSAVISAASNMSTLSKIISRGDNLEQIFRVLVQILKSRNMLKE